MRNLFFILITIGVIQSSPGASYEYGYSARAVSLSSALVADTYNTMQSFSNPSVLNQCKGQNYGLSYFMMSLDRSLQTFYYSRKLAGNAGISAAVLRSSIENFMGKDSFNNPTNELSNSDYYGLLSFGVGSKSGNGIGISMKIHYSNLYVNELHIDKYTGSSITVDFGGIMKVNPKLRIGFKIQNFINPNINWDIDRGDGLSNTYDESYPLIISVGSKIKAWAPSNIYIQQDMYMVDINKSPYQENTKLGYEHIILEDFLIRCGFQSNKNYNFGFGYKFNFNQFLVAIDYAIDLGSKNEGISHLFTWSTSL